MVVILGILAATALPKFINVGTDARVAAIKALSGSLQSTAHLWHGICLMKRTECNIANGWPNTLNYNGTSVQFANDFPEAGDNINTYQIDVLIEHGGFTVSLPSNIQTRFSLNNAPDSANCSVTYQQAGTVGPPAITSVTSGC